MKIYKDDVITLNLRWFLTKNCIKGVHHIAINVTNMEQSLKFYQHVLGLRPLFEPQEGSGSNLEKAIRVSGAKLKYAMLQSGETFVELIQYLSPKGKPYDRKNCDTGNMHLAFCVSNIDETFAELKEKGVKFNAPPMKIDAGALKGKAFAYFTDPDGVTLEIFQD